MSIPEIVSKTTNVIGSRIPDSQSNGPVFDSLGSSMDIQSFLDENLNQGAVYQCFEAPNCSKKGSSRLLSPLFHRPMGLLWFSIQTTRSLVSVMTVY